MTYPAIWVALDSRLRLALRICKGDYRELLASDAILRFLADHGPSPRKTILDTLEHQIRTKSDKPRNIVRNCLAQLAKRERVEIDPGGNVSPKQGG